MLKSITKPTVSSRTLMRDKIVVQLSNSCQRCRFCEMLNEAMPAED